MSDGIASAGRRGDVDGVHAVASELLPSQAERAADALRADILRGRFGPGERLVEAGLAAELGVSRNTLREAFRVLAHDRLVVHQPHRGVIVRRVHPDEGRQLYAARRALECASLREVALLDEEQWRPGLARVEDAVAAGARAAGGGDWREVGSANAEFHMALVALAGNQVVDAMMRVLTSATRLLFLGLGDQGQVHARFVDENRHLLDLVRAGHPARAALAMETYLLAAEGRLLRS